MLKHLVADIDGVSYHQKLGTGRFFRAGYQNKARDVDRRSKDFYLKELGAKKSLEAAIAKRKDWEKKFGSDPRSESAIASSNRVYENKYSIKGDYFLLNVRHSKKMIFRDYKIDTKYLDDVMEHYWYLNIYNSSARTRIDGDVVTLREFLFGDREGIINHINRDKFDYREANVVFENSANYVKARNYDKTETAPPGVHYWEDEDGNKFWLARFDKGDFNKKKNFSFSKFGERKAKARAIELREEWEYLYKRGELYE